MQKHRVVRMGLIVLTGVLLCPNTVSFAEAVPQRRVTENLASLPPEERGDLLMVHQQYLAAIGAYHEAPQDAQVLNKTGIAYHHLLALDLARKDYEKALLIQPNYPEAINNLGATYFDQRKYKQAIRLYRRALKLMPHSAVIAANLGTAYFARGKLTQGVESYRRALALDPGVFDTNSLQVIPGAVDIHERARQDYALAELFAQSGLRQRAVEYLRKAFNEGFNDRNRLMQDSVFTELRKSAEFAQLMAEQKVH